MVTDSGSDDLDWMLSVPGGAATGFGGGDLNVHEWSEPVLSTFSAIDISLSGRFNESLAVRFPVPEVFNDRRVVELSSA